MFLVLWFSCQVQHDCPQLGCVAKYHAGGPHPGRVRGSFGHVHQVVPLTEMSPCARPVVRVGTIGERVRGDPPEKARDADLVLAGELKVRSEGLQKALRN